LYPIKAVEGACNSEMTNEFEIGISSFKVVIGESGGERDVSWGRVCIGTNVIFRAVIVTTNTPLPEGDSALLTVTWSNAVTGTENVTAYGGAGNTVESNRFFDVAGWTNAIITVDGTNGTCVVSSNVDVTVVEIAEVRQSKDAICGISGCTNSTAVLYAIPNPTNMFPVNWPVWTNWAGPVSWSGITAGSTAITVTATGPSAATNDIKITGICGTSSTQNLGITSVAITGISFKVEGSTNSVLAPGKTGKAHAISVLPGCRTVNWTIEDLKPENEGDPAPELDTPLSGTVTDTGVFEIKANEKTHSGYATIRMVDSVTGCGWKKTISIGCECLACQRFGEGEPQNNSVSLKFSLGGAAGGGGSGNIQIKAGDASSALSQPDSIRPVEGPYHAGQTSVATNKQFGFQNESMEYVVDDNGRPRQIKVADGLMDVVVSDQFKYDLVFYPAAAVGTKGTNGLYGVTGSPKVRYTIENPDASTNVYNRLRVTRVTSSETNVTEYVQSNVNGTNEWTMTSGNGLRIEKVARYADGSDSNVLRTVTSPAGEILSRELSVQRSFAWGQELVSQVIDPDGQALTTTSSYYTDPAETGRYSRVSMVVNPDGSWTKYDYNTSGQIICEISGFKDAGTNASASEARATYYDYTLHAGEAAGLYPYSARTVTETTLGKTNSITYTAYQVNSSGEMEEITERAFDVSSPYGSSNNLRSVSTYYAEDSSAGRVDRIRKVEQSDGRLDTYTYESGTYTTNADPALCIFTEGEGPYQRMTVTHGTKNNPNGVAYKTTREVSVADSMGGNVLSETYVYNGSDYERIRWTVQCLDADRRPVAVYNSDGTRSEATWGCCGKEWERDAGGIERTYSFDALNRQDISTKQADNPIIQSSVFDAAGRTLTNTISSGGLVQRTSSAYNTAGEQTNSVDAAGLVTRSFSEQGGRIRTTILPGGITNYSENYLDGRIKLTKLNGVIQQYYDYGVNSDGTQWQMVYAGPAGTNSPMWSKTTSDFLGRTIRTEQPGFSSVVTNFSFFNSKGQLRSSVFICGSISNSTLYEYNELGEQVRAGLDVDGNGTLDLASMDRISESETYYEKDSSNNWWGTYTSKLYAKDNSSDVTTNSVQKTRLTGLGAGGLVSYAVLQDILGNQTISKTTIDRENKTVTQTVVYLDSTNSAVSVSINGLAVSSTSKTGIQITTGFDALERPVTYTDPRTGTSTVHYNEKGQIDWAQEAASNKTQYAYDPDTGRQISTTDALSNSIYTAYDNVKNVVVGTWGATYPVAYEFDDFNRMTAMYTYRGTNEINSYADLVALKSSMDKTQWKYDLATGLLTNKVYADGKGPSYSYTAAGKLASRTWARGVVTTYSFDPITGDMTNIAYSVTNTPSVSFTFNRLGQQVQIADGTGSRIFTYNDQLQLAAETNVLGQITRSYDSLGRSSGFSVGTDYAVAYGYSDVGRFLSISSSVQSVSSVVDYSYLPNSDLVSGWSNGVVSVVKNYEPNRNLLVSVDNRTNGAMVSRFDYANDVLGRRTQRIDSGSAVATNSFGYNLRSELTNAVMGGNSYAWNLDSIGNRITDTSNSVTHSYTANALNQYTQITNGGLRTLSYDLDGNLTNDGVFAYTWDAENRLISASSNGTEIASYKYDYMSRRYQKVVGSTTNTFLYDGWNLARSVTLSNDGVVTNDYVWGLDLSGSLQGAGGIGGLLSVTRNGVAYFPVTDANGNITDYMDASGAVVAHREFDAYGNTVVASGAMVNDFHFWFSSKYLDYGTGLYYYGYRYYDARNGRWLGRDPIGTAGGFNIYGFVNNSPNDAIDLLGARMIAWDDADKIFFNIKKIKDSKIWKDAVASGKTSEKIYAIRESFRTTIIDQLVPTCACGPIDIQHLLFIAYQSYQGKNDSDVLLWHKNHPTGGDTPDDWFSNAFGIIMAQDMKQNGIQEAGDIELDKLIEVMKAVVSSCRPVKQKKITERLRDMRDQYFAIIGGSMHKKVAGGLGDVRNIDEYHTTLPLSYCSEIEKVARAVQLQNDGYGTGAYCACCSDKKDPFEKAKEELKNVGFEAFLINEGKESYGLGLKRIVKSVKAVDNYKPVK